MGTENEYGGNLVMENICITPGTRPGIIKPAPVIKACDDWGYGLLYSAHRQHYSHEMNRVFFEVWNPGALPDGWTVEKLKEEHESIPKNPLIADHFFLTRFIEKWGTGTIEMIRRCEEWDVPDPEFRDTGTSIVVTFRKSEFTEEFLDSLHLNEKQKKAVGFVKTEKKITRSEYEQMSGISERTANRELSDLVKLSIFDKIGRGPNVYYELTKISPNLAKPRQTSPERWGKWGG